jgi:hypothetical protein
MQPIHYYVEETDQMNAFMNLVGEYFEKLTHCQLWDLNMVLSYDLGRRNLRDKPYDRLRGLLSTHFEILQLSEDALLEQVLNILENIPRKTAKQLTMAIAAIAADSDQY